MAQCKRTLFGDTLEYFSPMARPPVVRPNAGVPETIVLHVAPSACGRRMSIGSFQEHTNNRRAHLYISEEDIVSGCYEDLIPEAVEQLLRRKKPTPRAVSIVVTCIDDLLGTDHDALMRILKARFPQLRFCVRHVDPIGLDHRVPPIISMQLASYTMLDKSDTRVDAFNLVGVMDPITPASEMHQLLGQMGIGLRQIELCQTFDEFLAMSTSRLNLAIAPMGLPPVQQMEADLGIPYLYIPGSYSISAIAQAYRDIAAFFRRDCPDLTPYIAAAQADVAQTREQLGDMPIAVDSSGDFRPASLARTLLEYGFSVQLVLVGLLFDGNPEDVDWIRTHHPEVRIISDRGFNLMDWGEAYRRCICIGFSGAYAIGAEHLVDFSEPQLDYGFHAVSVLMDKLRRAAVTPADYGKLMRESEVWKP